MNLSFLQELNVSIHAPAGGATYCTAVIERRSFVSIHAPAGGATSYNGGAYQMQLCFNPRPCGRSDTYIIDEVGYADMFQSTPLREERRF